MSNLLTNSRLRVNRDCRRRHKLMYLDGWRPIYQGDALVFGILVHHGLEAWWEGTDGRLADALDAIANRARDPYQQVAAEEVLAAYDAAWLPGHDRYEVLAVEESFTAPLINVESGRPSRTWLIAGKVDAVVRDLADGRILLVEHKTTADPIDDPAATYWRKLAMDPQISHYMYGAEVLGHPVEGCLYDVLLRPRLRPFQSTAEEKRKYKKDGTLYGNQHAEDEHPEEYRLRVRADIEKAPAKYLQRREVPRTESDLREYLADLWAEGRIMREAELAGRAPRSPESCHRFGTCPFWVTCAEGAVLDDLPDQFERVEDVHPELELEMEVS